MSVPIVYYALSVHQPWATAIVLGFKPIENRDWAPWAKIIGKRTFIHSTKVRPELADCAAVSKLTGVPQSEVLQWPTGSVVGSVAVIGCITDPQNLSPAAQAWWAGPRAWLLEKPKAMVEPLPMKGAQGLWPVPDLALTELSQARRWRR